MTHKKNLAFKIIDRLFIVVYGAESPSDAEWITYLQAVENQGVEATMHLIFTECGAPTRAQRRYLSELLQGKRSTLAVVSANKVLRGAVAMMSWINASIRAFSPGEIGSALMFLGVSPMMTELILKEADQLKHQVCTAA